jgi:hypothetical protein
MTINHYFNAESPLKEYAGSRPANPGSLPPANATRTAPPEAEGFWPIWNGTAWTLKEDHRGEKGWLDGQEHTIESLGPLPEGWSSEPPEPTAEEFIAGKLARLKYLLSKIDAASIRPLRAITDGTDTELDRIKLDNLNGKAAEIRDYVSHPGDATKEMLDAWEASI